MKSQHQNPLPPKQFLKSQASPPYHHHTQPLNNQTHEKQYISKYGLLSDISSTHIQFKLVLIKPPLNQPVQQVKSAKYLVKDYENYQQAVRNFLTDTFNILRENKDIKTQNISINNNKYPTLAVVSVAGPVQNGKVKLCNVTKWDQLDSDKLAKQFGIQNFMFLNDCLAYSYGLLICEQDNFIPLNGKQINPKQTRGVLSLGVGLGNSIICSAPFRKRQRYYVFPGEFGHCDTPWINETTQQYLKFLAQKMGRNYPVHEHTFCGQAIPYIYQFFSKKNPNLIKNQNTKILKTEQIIQTYMKNRQSQSESLQKLTVQYFIQLYCTAIQCARGIYLIGNITLAVVDRLKQINIIDRFLQRHPEMTKILQKVGIVVSKETDLGLKGAYVYARRVIADQQHD